MSDDKNPSPDRARADSFTRHFRWRLEIELYQSVHNEMTQKVGQIFAITGVSARLAYFVFGRTFETDADSTWLPDFSTDYGRNVIIHHDRIATRAASLDMLLRLREAGNHVVYMADNVDDLPAIIRENANAIISPEVNAFALAVDAFRAFLSAHRKDKGSDFKLYNAEKQLVEDPDYIFYKSEGVRKGNAFRRISQPLAFLPEIFFLFRDSVYDGVMSAHVAVQCAEWKKIALRTADVGTRELEDVPDLAAFPGISRFKSRLELLLDRFSTTKGSRSGILLYGPPGTGKTMLARTIAKATGRNLVVASIGAWQSGGHLHEMLAAMDDSFRRAKELAPSLLFIDELDSLPDRRTPRSQFYETAVTNRFLEQVEGFNDRGDVLMLAATNNKEAIDPAVLRPGRFGEHIFVPIPGIRDIEEIVTWYLDQADCRHGISADVVAVDVAARIGAVSPATVRAVIEEAVHDCNRLKEPLDNDHIDRAIDAAAANLTLAKPTEEDRRRTAVHEAGHAILLHILGNGDSIKEASIRDDIRTLGRVVKSDVWLSSPPGVGADIAAGIVSMGGRVSEMLNLGVSGMGYGSSGDIDAAVANGTTLARAGLSPEGMYAFVDPADSVMVDIAARQWLSFFNNSAIDLMKPHLEALNSFATILLADGVLAGDRCHAHFLASNVPTNAKVSLLDA